MSDYITGSIHEDKVSYWINMAEPKSKWSFGPEFHCEFFTTAPMPNWFHRTMQRLILGIHWRKIDNGY